MLQDVAGLSRALHNKKWKYLLTVLQGSSEFAVAWCRHAPLFSSSAAPSCTTGLAPDADPGLRMVLFEASLGQSNKPNR